MWAVLIGLFSESTYDGFSTRTRDKSRDCEERTTTTSVISRSAVEGYATVDAGGVDQVVLVAGAGCVPKDEPTADGPNELFMRSFAPDPETADPSEREGGMG